MTIIDLMLLIWIGNGMWVAVVLGNVCPRSLPWWWSINDTPTHFLI